MYLWSAGEIGDQRNLRYEHMITEVEGFWPLLLEVIDDFDSETNDALVDKLRTNLDDKRDSTMRCCPAICPCVAAALDL